MWQTLVGALIFFFGVLCGAALKTKPSISED